MLFRSGSSFVLVVLFAIWRYFPYAFISFLAILQTIDKSLYEAAEMDGANAWQRFRIVTLPAIMPVLATVVTLRTIWMFYMFADVYLLTTKVDILGVYLYKTAFAFNDLGKIGKVNRQNKALGKLVSGKKSDAGLYHRLLCPDELLRHSFYT